MTDNPLLTGPVQTECETCYGEGWYWNELLREEHPCIDCEGIGLRRGDPASAVVEVVLPKGEG